MIKNISLLMIALLILDNIAGYCQNNSGPLNLNDLAVQGTDTSPLGLNLNSANTFNNNQALGVIGLGRKSYMSSSGSGNDLTDNVGIWIKGFYQNTGVGLPIFLGGYGYHSEDFRMIVDKNGNVGVGTDRPGTFYNQNQVNWPKTYNPDDKVLTIGAGNLPVLEFARPGANLSEGDRLGAIYFINTSGQLDTHRQIAGMWCEGTGGSPLSNLAGGKLVFMTKAMGDGVQHKMVMDAEGNVGIGTSDAKGYKLAVAGSMIAEKIKVKLQTAWPDYVFQDDYKLPSLQEIERYVQVNKHLPGVPSAVEVKKEGLDLEEMNRLLLQKVEELTLHMIAQQKEIAELKTEMQKLRR